MISGSVSKWWTWPQYTRQFQYMYVYIYMCIYIYIEREREYRLGDWPSNLGVPDFETNQLVAMMQGRSEMSHCASS